jgi:hypothetical protein
MEIDQIGRAVDLTRGPYPHVEMDRERQRHAGPGPFPVVRSEDDILQLALHAAARAGDPTPELIQHTKGTREAATKTTGSWVHGDEPSYLVAMRGKFSARRPSRPWDPTGEPGLPADRVVAFSVKVLVVSIETGRLADSGSSNEYPDLASVGPVVTDHRVSS